MTSAKNTLYKALILTLITLLLVAMTSGNAQAKNLGQIDPEGDQAIEVIAQDLKIHSTQGLANPTIIQTFHKAGRDYYQLEFSHEVVKTVRLMISGPKDFMQNSQRYGSLFLSAGFFVGMHSIGLIDNPGDLVLIGFEYPSTMDMIKKDPSVLFKTIRVVPGQMALALEWIQKQTWVSNLSVMGVSLGSLFMPSGLRLAEMRGFTPHSTIFAFGGAHIIPVIEQKLKPEMSPMVLKLTLNFFANLASLHDPKIHLASLKGPFLAIYGDQDEVFPKESSLLQYDLLQGDKEIFWVKGLHIDTNKPDVIKDTMDKVLEFLNRTNFFSK